MAVRPYTAPQGDEKRVFHHPANRLPLTGDGHGKLWYGGVGLAAAHQLGPAAEVPAGAGAGADEGARVGRDAAHVRRECSLRDQYSHPGLEPAETRTPLRDAVWRRSAGSIRARRHRLSDRASFAMDTEGECPLVLRVDQG